MVVLHRASCIRADSGALVTTNIAIHLSTRSHLNLDPRSSIYSLLLIVFYSSSIPYRISPSLVIQDSSSVLCVLFFSPSGNHHQHRSRPARGLLAIHRSMTTSPIKANGSLTSPGDGYGSTSPLSDVSGSSPI